MLTTQQQALIKAIEELELAQVQKLLAEGLDPNFIDRNKGHLYQSFVMEFLNGGKMYQKLMKRVHHYQKKKSNNHYKFISIFSKL